MGHPLGRNKRKAGFQESQNPSKRRDFFRMTGSHKEVTGKEEVHKSHGDVSLFPKSQLLIGQLGRAWMKGETQTSLRAVTLTPVCLRSNPNSTTYSFCDV